MMSNQQPSAAFQNESKNLPPGWDCKYDTKTGKCYYFNYITKAMSLEDPRIRLRQQQHPSEHTQVEAIPLQPMHGSPYHVYPTNNYPAVQAFQGPSAAPAHLQQQFYPAHNGSPMLATKFQQQMEMTQITRQTGSPHLPRIMSQLANQAPYPSQPPYPMPSHQYPTAQHAAYPLQHLNQPMPFANAPQQQYQSQGGHPAQQETSFSTPADLEAAVTKINTMFPTTNDTHIRMLLKKYHYREAVVISALQVEKHPLTTPGPFATPPPPGRHATLLAAAANAFGISASTTTMQTTVMMTPPLGGGRFAGIVSDAVSRSGSPVPWRPGSSCASVGTSHNYNNGTLYGSPRVGESYRSSPKPHSSPKMKLRYLKSIFPKADEMLLLDLLANADNNVQHASEKLLTMGYEKRDTTAPKVTNRNREEQVMRDRQIAQNTPPPQPRVKTNEEKAKTKSQLQAQHPDIAARIITMALESVDYSEERACQILKIVMQDDTKNGNKSTPEVVAKNTTQQSSTSDPRSTIIGSATISNAPTHPMSNPSIDSMPLLPSQPSNDPSASEVDGSVQTPLSPEAAITSASVRKSNRCRAKSCLKNDAEVAASACAHTISTSTTATTIKSQQSCPELQSAVARVPNDGPNASLRKGPNEDLLLSDYVAWNGANPEMNSNRKCLARGADPSNRVGSRRGSAGATGPNAELCKGVNVGLAKGSRYDQMSRQMPNVKCN